MTGLLLQIGATKLAVSVVLAGAVWIVHRRVDRPAISYPLWLLVLVTMLVPTVISLPVLPEVPAVPPAAPDAGAFRTVLAQGAASHTATDLRPGALAQQGIAIIWLLGTVGLLGWTPVRTIRFRRTLTGALRPSPEWLQQLAAEISRDLGLRRTPEVHTTVARVTPMVWWTGGRVRVLVPAFLLTDPNPEEVRGILAHELAHVRRRDHVVRWLEWLVCSAFWWNPVAWWARRELRIAEESCCDRLALGTGTCCPRTYAKALLRVAVGTSDPTGFRPTLPASATGGVESTTNLERRLKLIVSTIPASPAPRRVRAAIWMAAVCAFSLGLVYCDRPTGPMTSDEETGLDPFEGAALESSDEVSAAVDEFVDLVSRRETELQERIRVAVEAGELSEQEGRQLSAYVTRAAQGDATRSAAEHETSVDGFMRAPLSEGECRQCHVPAGGVRRNALPGVGHVSPAPTLDLPRLRSALAEMQAGKWP